MSQIASLLLRYVVAWFAMSVVFFVLLLLAEGASGYLAERLRFGSGAVSGINSMLQALHGPVMIPDTAARFTAIYYPVLAIAALLPIPACIPSFNFIPLLGNGGDLLQIVQFALMSEALALISIWSLGTERSKQAGMELFLESFLLLFSFAATFISLSFYLTANGIVGDTFSLNLITDSMYFNSLRICGRIAALLFTFVILAQASYSATCASSSPFYMLEMPGYDGPQRALLLLWAALRTFVVISLITHIFFPWGVLRSAEITAGGKWWTASFHFALFWLAVVVVRVLVVPLLRGVLDRLQAKFSRVHGVAFILLLTGVAMILMYVEAYLSSMEAF